MLWVWRESSDKANMACLGGERVFRVKKLTRLILALLIGISGTIGLFYFAGWKTAVCIFLIIWANNIDRSTK